MGNTEKKRLKNIVGIAAVLLILWCLFLSGASGLNVCAKETSASITAKALTGEEIQGGYDTWRFDVKHNERTYLGFCAQKGLDSASSGTFACKEIQNDRLKAVLLVSLGSPFQNLSWWTNVNKTQWIDVMHGTITYAYTGDRVMYDENGGIGYITYFDTVKAEELANAIYSAFAPGILNSYKMYLGINPDASQQDVIWLEGYGKIQLQKVDQDTGEGIAQGDAVLEGAIYDVFLKSAYRKGDGTESESYQGSMITDSAGCAVSEILPLDTYFVKERQSSEGYLLDPNLYEVTISEKSKAEDVFTEASAVSEILPLDTYFVKERQSSEGYLLDPNLYEVTISEKSKAEDVFTEAIVSREKVIDRTVRVVKVDADTGKVIPLKNTQFRLLDEERNPLFFSIEGETEKTDVFQTDESGEWTFPIRLVYGTYYLEEVQAPNGYLKGELLEFEIRETDSEENPLTIQYADENVMGKVVITKVCKETQKKLDGAVFEICAAEDIVTPDGTLRLKKGEKADEVTTQDGVAVSKKLFLGVYEIREKKQPLGFVLDPKKYLVKLEYQDQLTSVVTGEITIENQLEEIPEEPDQETPVKKEIVKKAVQTGDIVPKQFYLSVTLSIMSGLFFLLKKRENKKRR